MHDTEVVRATGIAGRTVVPFGDYAFYPSGMAIGGLCWYRLLPGFAGTDPISLAKAVVQVCDLLDDLAMPSPVLTGFGQGAVVALGAGSLRPDRVGSVVAIDPHPADVALAGSRLGGAGSATGARGRLVARRCCGARGVVGVAG